MSAGTTTTTSFSFTGLGCGTSHVLGVQAFDAAGNVSPRATGDGLDRGLPGRDGSFRADGADSGGDDDHVDRRLVGGFDGQRRRDRLRAASWTAVSAGTTTTTSFSFTGLGLRDEPRAGRAGLRRGGQRLAARDGDGLDRRLPRRDGAVRAERR